MTVHLIRMAAGIEDMETLHAYVQREIRTEKGFGKVVSIHTRNTPRRTADLLEGGSLYSVFRSIIQCRRKILDIRAKKIKGEDYCEILLDPAFIRVMPMPYKPFQGWRYLEPARAPADLGVYKGVGKDAPPEEIAEDLRAAGLL
jgi:hypothetical protein